MGQRYCRMEDKKQLSGLPKLKSEKVKSGRRTVTQTFHRPGSGAEPPAAGGFGGLESKPPKAEQFIKKQAYSNPNAIGSQFGRVQSHLKEPDFHTKPIEKIKMFNAHFAYNLSPKHI